MLTHTMTTNHAALAPRAEQAAPCRESVTPMSWPARLLLMLIAFAGSAVYAASYRLISSAADLTPIAAAIGIAAATAWIGFGFLLLMIAVMHPKRFGRISVWHWADACLITMALGMGIKMLGVGANVIIASLGGGSVELALIAPLQLALLIATDVVMGLCFARLGGRLGLPQRTAWVMWIVALNGIFAAVLASLLAYGGFVP